MLYKRGSVGPCVCWKGVWGNRVAAGFAKHGSELPRVAFRGLTMSRARLWGGTHNLSTDGFSFAFLLDPHFFVHPAFQMSVNARRHRLNMCLGGLVGYDVLPSAKLGTSLLHTQKVASSSLASSTFFFFYPPHAPKAPSVVCARKILENPVLSLFCPSPASKPLQSAKGGVLAVKFKKK